mgnify:CR=1 FL=1
MTNTLKPLVFNLIKSYLSEEQVFEIIEEIELDEAVNTFNDLPAAWKRVATSKWEGKRGGQDSKIEVLAATKTIKSAENIISTMRKALRRDGAALVWIEMNGEPLVAINKNQFNEYTLLYPSGEFVTKKVRQQQPGTGKYVGGGIGKYVPPRYWETEEKTLKPTEAAEKMWEVAFETLERMNKDLPKPKASVFELAQEMKFEVRIMYPDENRIAKMKERSASKSGMNSDIMKNRKAAVERVVKQKITPIIDRIKAEVDTQVSNALEGKRFDFKEIEKELQRIGSISGRLQRILMSDELRLKNSSWGDEKAQLNYDLKHLMNDLKKLDD